MDIYAIGDLHLSLATDKPMDIFGPAWKNHMERLAKNWKGTVKEEDIVIVPGDISWAMHLKDALPDIEFISALPGIKVFVKGNHDLWWSAISKLNALDERIFFLQNSFYDAGSVAICGSRGWLCPGGDGFSEHDGKIYNRECHRLKLSLESARNAGKEKIIAALHFPPTNEKKQPSGFTAIFEEYAVSEVVYGHLHGDEVFGNGLKGYYRGTSYSLVSLDYLQCTPKLIMSVTNS